MVAEDSKPGQSGGWKDTGDVAGKGESWVGGVAAWCGGERGEAAGDAESGSRVMNGMWQRLKLWC